MDELCQEKIIDEDLAERIRKVTAKDAASSLVYQCVCVQKLINCTTEQQVCSWTSMNKCIVFIMWTSQCNN